MAGAGRRFDLRGLDGANPLGFLAALGTLVTLHRRGAATVRLWWEPSTRWVPVLDGVPAADEEQLAEEIARALRGRTVARTAEGERETAQRAMDEAKTAIKKKQDDIKRRGLDRTHRAEVVERELRPLEREYEERRQRWLAALRQAVPRPELALAKRIEDATAEDYRELAQAILAESDREGLDLLAAFGSDACLDKQGRVEATPFEFTTGSGSQFFLNDVRQLVAKVEPKRVRDVLFQPWTYRDEGLSLRWDPLEDRRYAFLDRDPTASGNKPRTVWMANLLAYCGLALFPTAPSRRQLVAAGWAERDRGRHFTWPLWVLPARLDVVRTLVQARDLTRERPAASQLSARGIVAVYRARRIAVGSGANKKWNFAPPRQILAAAGSAG